jgi:regulator of protease activity HflC (stomatin/prohibitin superfamily)
MGNEYVSNTATALGWIKKGAAGILAFVVLSTVFGSFYTIESGKVGVIQTFGKYNESVSLPGLHWKRPFIDTVLEQDVKLQTVNYVGGSDERDESGIINKPHLDVLDRSPRRCR